MKVCDNTRKLNPKSKSKSLTLQTTPKPRYTKTYSMNLPNCHTSDYKDRFHVSGRLNWDILTLNSSKVLRVSWTTFKISRSLWGTTGMAPTDDSSRTGTLSWTNYKLCDYVIFEEQITLNITNYATLSQLLLSSLLLHIFESILI